MGDDKTNGRAAPALRGPPSVTDRIFGGLAMSSASLVLVILGLVLLVVTHRAWGVLSVQGLEFFTSSRWAPAEQAYGALALVWGTLITATIAVLLSVPVSVGIALYVTQIAPPWMKKPVVQIMDLLAGVPSVVFGLWGLQFLAPHMVPIYDAVHRVFSLVPGLGQILGVPSQTGRSFFTAGIILAVMITPIITSLAREVVETTPPMEREGALALGATRWEMISGVVLPHSLGGLVGAIMLGLGRALGETIAVALVIGSAAQLTLNVFAAGDAMPAVIVNQWGEADEMHKSALIALAFTLFIMTVIVNMTADSAVIRFMRHARGR
jgi:phosphate transport system permease protein